MTSHSCMGGTARLAAVSQGWLPWAGSGRPHTLTALNVAAATLLPNPADSDVA